MAKPFNQKTVLTIAGFDPSSGAGVAADLMVFAAHRLFGTSCITALTVQNTLGVVASLPVAPDTVRSTLECLYTDLPPAGIKIGVLATAEIVSTVAAFLTRIRAQAPVVVVLDPVLKSSSGRDLLDSSGLSRMREELLPLVDWITPNISELGALLGLPLHQQGDPLNSAMELQKLGKNLSLVITCGDLDPPHDLLLLSNSFKTSLPGDHVETSATHGTGCAFSSALLSHLVQGDTPLEAAFAAKAYVAEAMRLAAPLGKGKGPLNHLWPLSKEAQE